MSLVSKPSENRRLVIVEAVITFGDQAPPETHGLGADSIVCCRLRNLYSVRCGVRDGLASPTSRQNQVMVELRLKGKVALVTGASRGIGASVARMLAGRGADIAINYHSKGSRAEDVATEVRAIGRRALLVQADLTNPDDVTAMIELVRVEYGRLDVLILNASGGLMINDRSNGQVEGQVNRLKMIKRCMFGRARFDLLASACFHAPKKRALSFFTTKAYPLHRQVQ
jgi:NADPH:quinone reductase-like Zn-dependent oxidoreductase